MRVCVGGTFDPIHRGHEALLAQAFKVSGLGERKYVFIGVTGDALAQASRKLTVTNYEKRRKNLERFLEKKGYKNYEIGRLDDRFGPAIEGKFDACVVSPGSRSNAMELNARRVQAGNEALKTFVVDYVLADDLKPISGTRIKQGIITPSGKMRVPVAIAVGSTNVVKTDAVYNVFARISKKVEVVGYKTASRVSEQPIDTETIKGAMNRARAASAAWHKEHEGNYPDYAIGIEAGLIWNDVLKDYLDVQYCAVLDDNGKITVGHGSGFIYPRAMIDEVYAGKTMGEAFEDFTGIDAIGSKMGAIGYLTDMRLTRTELTEQAVFMALVPRMKPGLYEHEAQQEREMQVEQGWQYERNCAHEGYKSEHR